MQLLRKLKISFVCCILVLILSIAVFARDEELVEMDNPSGVDYFDDIVYFLKDIPSYSGRLRLGPVEISPSLDISETFTDNVFGAPNNKVGDFYTTYEPGIILELPFLRKHSLRDLP